MSSVRVGSGGGVWMVCSLLMSRLYIDVNFPFVSSQIGSFMVAMRFVLYLNLLMRTELIS